MSHQPERVPVHFPATPNTVYRGDRRYETDLDVAVDLVALREGELDQHETVLLVDYLTSLVYDWREYAPAQ